MPIRDPVLKRFGGNVRTKREARKLSQEALAEQAGLDIRCRKWLRQAIIQEPT
jgi:transcriptional regulator with XRE-family HTH domain